MRADPVTHKPRLAWLAGPALLFLILCGFYWRLILSNQYTWVDSPDLVHMEIPRFQFQAARWHAHRFPLWDPYQWCGQPFLGQMTGAACPLTWPFVLMPLDSSGKVHLSALHWYFVLLHFLGGLFAWWLCRDLRLSAAASLVGGVVFALSGFFGTASWTVMMAGFLWTPLIFLFLLRVLRGRRPLASAALCGLFVGASWLSGHHEVPTYVSLAVAGIWLYHMATSRGPLRRRSLGLAMVAALSAALTSGFQTLPGYEYARLAKRWVGADHPVTFNEPVPYSVDASYSLSPGSIPSLVIPWLPADVNAYLGVTAVTLALFGVLTGWSAPAVRIFLGVALFGLLFAMGTYNVFHGILYAVVPLFGKARSPVRMLCLVDLAAAPLAAYGIDALRAGAASSALRRIALALAIAGGAIYAVALGAGVLHPFQANPNFMVAAFAALLVAALLTAWLRKAVGERFLVAGLLAIIIAELAVVTGTFSRRDARGPGTVAGKLNGFEDIARFLKAQPGFQRILFDDTFNIGDWEGIDCLGGFGAGVTANILSLEWAQPRTQDLLGVTYSVTKAPTRAGQELAFQGASGLNVYRNPAAFPRAWSVHRAIRMSSAEKIHAALADTAFDRRATAPMTEDPPPLETCDPGGDEIRMPSHGPATIRIEARMNCRGMVILADTWFPGWYAAVDGRPAPIYQPYLALRGVVVEKGAHTILMRYRPASAILGGVMTLIGILGACFLALHAARTPARPDI